MNQRELIFVFLLSFLVLANLNRSECSSRPKRTLKNFNLLLAPALMLTTSDSISFVYPKEMGYEKDFLHTIYRINNNDTTFNKPLNTIYRIEDAVYDNQTWSIYFIVSNQTGGSEIYRLKHLNPFTSKPKSLKQSNLKLSLTNHGGHSFEIAANWSRSLLYKNNTGKILSLDINVKKRKIYWFEFNKLNKKWSIAIKKLSTQFSTVNYFQFDTEEGFFQNDGYNFMTVAQDNNNNNDLIVFVSNNQTLHICFLINMTCEDFFRVPPKVNSTVPKRVEVRQQIKEYDEDDLAYDDDDDDNAQLKFALLDEKMSEVVGASTARSTTLSTTTQEPPLYSFGRLMGIKYEQKEHVLYLSDYGFDRIEKITFENEGAFKFKGLETILKSEHGQTPINPIMSVFHESYLFWIDFEEGLKTTVYKSSCVRNIYKIKEANNLKFIQIGTFNFENLREIYYPTKSELAADSTLSASSQLRLLNRLVSLQTNKFQYPPDYYFYYPNSFNTRGLNFNSAQLYATFNLKIFFTFNVVSFLWQKILNQ